MAKKEVFLLNQCRKTLSGKLGSSHLRQPIKTSFASLCLLLADLAISLSELTSSKRKQNTSVLGSPHL